VSSQHEGECAAAEHAFGALPIRHPHGGGGGGVIDSSGSDCGTVGCQLCRTGVSVADRAADGREAHGGESAARRPVHPLCSAHLASVQCTAAVARQRMETHRGGRPAAVMAGSSRAGQSVQCSAVQRAVRLVASPATDRQTDRQRVSTAQREEADEAVQRVRRLQQDEQEQRKLAARTSSSTAPPAGGEFTVDEGNSGPIFLTRARAHFLLQPSSQN
jgi:hypothetical protein